MSLNSLPLTRLQKATITICHHLWGKGFLLPKQSYANALRRDVVQTDSGEQPCTRFAWWCETGQRCYSRVWQSPAALCPLPYIMNPWLITLHTDCCSIARAAGCSVTAQAIDAELTGFIREAGEKNKRCCGSTVTEPDVGFCCDPRWCFLGGCPSAWFVWNSINLALALGTD